MDLAIYCHFTAYRVLKKKIRIKDSELRLLVLISEINNNLGDYATTNMLSPLRGSQNMRTMYDCLSSLVSIGYVKQARKMVRLGPGKTNHAAWYMVSPMGRKVVSDYQKECERLKPVLERLVKTGLPSVLSDHFEYIKEN